MNQKRKKVVNDLIENRGWNEDLRTFLLSASKEALYAIVKNSSGNEGTDLELADMGVPVKPLLTKKDVSNASDDEEDEEDVENKKAKNKKSSKNADDEEDVEEEKKEKETKNKKKACNSIEEWLEVAPNQEIKEFLVKAVNDAKEAKDAIVKSLLENKDNKFTKEELEAKSKIELDKLNALVVNSSTPKKNLPAGSKTVTNSTETLLSIPTLQDVCGKKDSK